MTSKSSLPPGAARFEAFLKRAAKGLLITLLVVLGSLVLSVTLPVLAIILGTAVVGLVAAYLAKDKVRYAVDRKLGRREGAKRWSGTLTAAVVGGWAFVSLLSFGTFVATGGIERARAEEEARVGAARKEAEAEQAAKMAAREAQADVQLKEAEAAAASGQFAQARQLAEQVQNDLPGHAGTDDVLQRVQVGVQQQLRATLPAKLTAIEAESRAGRWVEAGRVCDEVKDVAAGHGELESACSKVRAQLRTAEVAGWIAEARRVVAEECDTPKSIAEAWEDLHQVNASDAAYATAKKAAVALEKCRKKAERDFDAALRQVMMAQREQNAREIETKALDSGLDFSVTVKGKYKDQMRIRWVLMGRAAVHQFTKDTGFLENMQKVGFRKVIFTDGYYESYTYDLEPESEDGGGKIALAGLGLDKPITM